MFSFLIMHFILRYEMRFPKNQHIYIDTHTHTHTHCVMECTWHKNINLICSKYFSLFSKSLKFLSTYCCGSHIETPLTYYELHIYIKVCNVKYSSLHFKLPLLVKMLLCHTECVKHNCKSLIYSWYLHMTL
jgi:hypothetical protein